MPRLIQDLLEKISGRCWPGWPREIVFFRNSGKFQKTIVPNWVHRRSFRQSLAGIFGNFKVLAFHCHRSNDTYLISFLPIWQDFGNLDLSLNSEKLSIFFQVSVPLRWLTASFWKACRLRFCDQERPTVSLTDAYKFLGSLLLISTRFAEGVTVSKVFSHV